jgi:bifunctional polynucleotide phosphatase/kinase
MTYPQIYCCSYLLQPARNLLPYLAFTGFRAKYEEPCEDEGLSEVKKINWVFQGTDEERRYWSMWLQIDGK